MEKVKKLSWLQMYKLRHDLKHYGLITEAYWPYVIDSLSEKDFSHGLYRGVVELLSFDYLHPLFAERNIKKLKRLCEYTRRRNQLANLVLEHGTDDEVRVFLSVADLDKISSSQKFVDKYFAARDPKEFLEPYVKAHECYLVPSIASSIIAANGDEALAFFINKYTAEIRDSWMSDIEAMLFKSPLERAKAAYAEKFIKIKTHFSQAFGDYVLSSGQKDLILTLLPKFMPSEDNLEALFNLNDEEIFALAIQKLANDLPNASLEVKLIKSGYPEVIKTYLGMIDELYSEAEKELVLSNQIELIKLYLEKFEDHTEFESIIFSYASAEVRQLYRTICTLPYGEEKELVLAGDSKLIKEYIKRHVLYGVNVIRLFKKADEDVIKCYLDKELVEISSPAQLVLIRRNSPELNKILIDKLLKDGDTLEDKALCEFIAHGDISLIRRYFDASYSISDEVALALYSRKEESLLEYSFNASQIELLAKEGSFDTVRWFFQKKMSECDENFEKGLASRNDLSLVPLLRQYIAQKGSALCAEAELMLFEREDKETEVFLHEYISLVPSLGGAETEMYLIENNKEELLFLYFAKNHLREDAETLLVQKGNRRLIETYIDKYNLCNDAIEELSSFY